MAWKEAAKKGKQLVSRGGDFPASLVVNDKEGQYGIFTMMGFRENVGKFHSNVYKVKAHEGDFQTASGKDRGPRVKMQAGKVYEFFGAGMLDKHLTKLKNGTKFGIKYGGIQPMTRNGKKTKQEAHIWEIISL